MIQYYNMPFEPGDQINVRIQNDPEVWRLGYAEDIRGGGSDGIEFLCNFNNTKEWFSMKQIRCIDTMCFYMDELIVVTNGIWSKYE